MTRSIHRFMRAAWGKRFGEWHDVEGVVVWSEGGGGGRAVDLMVCFFFFILSGVSVGVLLFDLLSVFVELYMH